MYVHLAHIKKPIMGAQLDWYCLVVDAFVPTCSFQSLQVFSCSKMHSSDLFPILPIWPLLTKKTLEIKWWSLRFSAKAIIYYRNTMFAVVE